MLDSLFGTGKLEKMIIVAFNPPQQAGETPVLSTADEDKYSVQVNPDNYTINYQVNYDRAPAPGNSGSDAKYVSTSPPALEFTFLFDGTGVIPPPAGPLDNVPIAGAVAGLFSGDEPYDVTKELQKFAKVVYTFDSSGHSPRRVQLTWGKLVFEGVLGSLSLNYKLFGPDGSPLRVEARATFEGSISDMLRELEENKNSPDLTHVRKVVAGDNILLMSNNIYGTPAYYIEVAKVNKLFNFRQLREGKEIFFPPAKKTKP
ncbi:CIS tube protein [Chitinophaga sp. 22620]|jgi:hypothetical protein|uniref:CIS tube protein n=1 Tax=Chitinophaga sp. 22620 TaxID=3453952 RepID=UPI003F874D38